MDEPTTQLRRLRETVKQADPAEDLSTVISNYNELEFCFRHSDVLHFAIRREAQESKEPTSTTNEIMRPNEESRKADIKSWSILLPICYDFIVLLGDDVKLLDLGWQERIVSR